MEEAPLQGSSKCLLPAFLTNHRAIFPRGFFSMGPFKRQRGIIALLLNSPGYIMKKYISGKVSEQK